MTAERITTARRGRPRKGHKSAGRSTIIRAARKLLKEHEPAALTRLMVAKAAGVDPQLIRYYFGTMQNLLAEVVLEGQSDIETAIVEMRHVEQPIARLEQRIRHRTQLFLDNPKYHQLVSNILRETPRSEHGDELVRILRDSLKDLEEVLEIGERQGELRGVDAALLHLTILGACEFVANNQNILRILRKRKTGKKELGTEFMEFFTDLLINGLKASGASKS